MSRGSSAPAFRVIDRLPTPADWVGPPLWLIESPWEKTVIAASNEDAAASACACCERLPQEGGRCARVMMGALLGARVVWPGWVYYQRLLVVEGAMLRGDAAMLAAAPPEDWRAGVPKSSAAARSDGHYAASRLRPVGAEVDGSYVERAWLFEVPLPDLTPAWAAADSAGMHLFRFYAYNASKWGRDLSECSEEMEAFWLAALQRRGLLVDAWQAPDAVLEEMFPGPLRRARKQGGDLRAALRADPKLAGKRLFMPPPGWSWLQWVEARYLSFAMYDDLASHMNGQPLPAGMARLIALGDPSWSRTAR